MISSAEEFKRYVESNNEDERIKAHESAPEEIWIEILRKHPDLSRQVAFNSTIPLTILELLSQSDNVEVRWDIAMKKRINRPIFERLSNDTSPSVRHRIACNSKTPQELLVKLSLDEDEMVSEAAKKRMKQPDN